MEPHFELSLLVEYECPLVHPSKASLMYYFGKLVCYCLILCATLWPCNATSFALWTLPNHASPLISYFTHPIWSGIVFISSRKVQPTVAPTSELNCCNFIPSFPLWISVNLITPIIGYAVVLNSVPVN